jgi:hypothetical protein
MQRHVTCTGITSPTEALKEQTMFRKHYSLGTRIAIATALAIGTSSVALADDSSMNPFSGDFYRELHNGQNLGNSNLARAPRASVKDMTVQCENPDAQKVSQAEHLLALTPTAIFSDKGV